MKSQKWEEWREQNFSALHWVIGRINYVENILVLCTQDMYPELHEWKATHTASLSLPSCISEPGESIKYCELCFML